MNVTEVLTKARDHLEDPTMWFQGRLAFDIGPDEPCCSIGAINWAIGGHPYPSEWGLPFSEALAGNRLAHDAVQVLGAAVKQHPAPWNDGDRAHKDILEGFDKAIKLSRGD